MGLLDWLFGKKPLSNTVADAREEASRILERSLDAKPVRFRDPPPPDPRYPLSIGQVPLELSVHVGTARSAREAGRLADARLHYQRAAYGFAQLSEAQNAALREEIAGFAREDPLYIEGIGLLRRQLCASPGALQADLTRGMDANNAEALRYVLYYADQLGDVVRVKSGRSYRLYLPDQPVPPEPEKPKRPRRPQSAAARE